MMSSKDRKKGESLKGKSNFQDDELPDQDRKSLKPLLSVENEV
jgi:hypothetical protein